MRTFKTIYLSLIFLCFIWSCGPSDAEKKAERERIEAEVKKKLESKMKIEETIATLKKSAEQTQNTIIETKAQLEVEKDRLAEIKVPQFLRSQSERESQIKNQMIRIQNMELELEELYRKKRKIGEDIQDNEKLLETFK